MRDKPFGFAVATFAALWLVACGGGGGGTNSPAATSANGSALSFSAASPGALSTGSISAFGSVFVNGHEYAMTGASVIDDDTGATTTSTAGLEVGMVADVKAAVSSSSEAPVAAELHLHPLVRGYVDAVGSSSTGQSLSVMGQTIQTSASTSFSDHRACLTASSPCAAITGLSGLTATTGTGASAVAGNYVTVHGYLFGSGSSPTSANVVATLISVADAPLAGAAGAVFKAEGLVTATGASTVTIGGLAVDLRSAACRASGAAVACAGAFSVGQIVSVFASNPPSLPATNLVAARAILRPGLLVNTAGVPVELEGSVSRVTTTAPASLTVRGIDVDASALPAGTGLPAVGDVVRVLGVVSSAGSSVTATSISVLRHSQSTTYAFAADISAVAAGAGTDTFTASVLGQTVIVNAASRLTDHSTRDWDNEDPAANPFNIKTFQAYLAASKSKHVVVQTFVDGTGSLQVVSLAIVPASTTDAVAGLVDATPAPVNGATTGAPTVFSVHGIVVTADPAAIRLEAHRSTAASAIAAGDKVTVFAAAPATGSALTVGAAPSRSNLVLDFGPPEAPGQGGDGGF